MQVVILAGGFGTRISEESAIRPKPMVEIGGRPILWHIMKIYMAHGLNDFVICCGYKGQVIKQFFRDYALDGADVRFDMRENTTTLLRTSSEPWRVTLVDTGQDTMTGGRIKRAAAYLQDGPFCCTYGDGVGNVDISASIAFHKAQGTLATVTAVQPPGRFGAFTLQSGHDRVPAFKEKPGGDGAWINGGFFVLDRKVIDLIEDDQTVWERGPMEKLAEDGQLSAFRHEGFWQPMDTLRDKQSLEALWASGKAPWKVW
ncbi:MAG TPA: glucose-1-phosphate cytidylyltransferase [Aquabacterium sp.]|nr:glucose-1-phosphate cytidylyltransferase [Aquabacterium sp.]